jgi:sterol desaturase/sphingolipid hydroxylase (fatty acid hydroxylase superfamily)
LDRPWQEALVACAAALFVSSLFEYWVHRIMHGGGPLARKHAEHHRDGFGQGWLGEFWDYWSGGLIILWVGFLYSVPAGIGFAAGGTLYAVAAAYAHQIQHERPHLCFWLPRPVHYLHHKHKMWRHNFGIMLDVWDRVFGTYMPVEWKPEKPFYRYPLADFFRISWIAYTPGPNDPELPAPEAAPAAVAPPVGVQSSASADAGASGKSGSD